MDGLPDGAELRPLGRRRLKDLDRPEELYELRIEGVTPARGNPAPLAASGAASDGIARARQDIEERVLAEVERSLRTSSLPPLPDVPGPLGRGGPTPPPRPDSVVGGIGRLKELRDAGALSDEQYARAVDRVLDRDAPTSG